METKYTKEYLDGLLKKRVKSIAKSFNIIGKSKWAKADYIDAIVQSRENIIKPSEEIKKPKSWFSEVFDKKVRVILVSLAAFLAIITFVINSVDFDTLYRKLNDSRIERNLKIAILPLSPDRDCNIQDTAFEDIITERINRLSDKFKVKAIYLDYEDCVRSDEQAISIADNYNCDLAIWGFYDERCMDSTKIRLRYTTVNEDNLYYASYGGHTEYQNLPDLEFLKNGELTRDIEYISSYFALMNAYRNGQYSLVVKEFNSMSIQNCNEEFLSILAKSYFKKGDIENARSTFEKLQSCLIENYEQDKLVISKLNKIAEEYPKDMSQSPNFFSLQKELSQLAYHRYMYFYYMGEEDFLVKLAPNFDTGNMTLEKNIELNKRINLGQAINYHNYSLGEPF